VSDRDTTLGVVVPTIGDRPELRRLLESVAVQLRPVNQLRVVVDGPDATLAESIVASLAGNLADIDTQILTTGAARPAGSYLADTGYGVAVNTGLSTLDTDLVAFLDDDDVILPTHFQNLEALLRPEQDVGVAYSRVLVERMDGTQETYQKDMPPSGSISPFVVIGSHPVLLPAALIHRSTLEKTGWLDETLDRKADTDMIVRLALATSFSASDQATYIYFRNPHGQDVRDRTLREMAILLRKHRNSMTRFERWQLWDAQLRAAIRSEIDDVADEAAHEVARLLSPIWHDWIAALYLRLRKIRTPEFLKQAARRARSTVD
jgi:glycosyltransferase involved in cell wall biosynthesis